MRLFTRAGIAAAMALTARQTGRVLSEPDRPHVEGDTGDAEVGTRDVRVAAYDRRALDALIEEAAAEYGVSAHLVRAVVQAESAFDPRAVSRAGAQGLMQLMPATAEHLGVEDPFDARQNLFGGVEYLSQLLDRFDGNVALALAGYNAGPTRVARHRGIPPYRETRGYVVKIRKMMGETTGALFPLPKPTVTRKARAAGVRRKAAAAARSLERRRVQTHRGARRPMPGGRS